MTESRSEPAGLWQDAADAVIVGLRRAVDYQRSIADDYRDRFLTSPGQGPEPIDWSAYTSGLVDYSATVVELTVDYYRSLADTAGRFAQESYPVYRQATGRTAYHGSDGRPTERATVEVRGVVGNPVEARFTIENSDDEAAEVFMDVGLCRSADGRRFAVPVELTPDSAVIEPRGAVSVRARLDLDPSLFETGAIHRLPIDIHGPHPAIIELEIAVDVDADVDADADADADSDAGEVEGDGPPADGEPRRYRVRCPSCGRTFDRKTADLKLRPHNDGDGNPCPRREATRTR